MNIKIAFKLQKSTNKINDHFKSTYLSIVEQGNQVTEKRAPAPAGVRVTGSVDQNDGNETENTSFLVKGTE